MTDYINRGVPPVYTQDNSGTAVINQKCIRDGRVSYEYSKLTDESVKSISSDKIVQKYDILINSTGTGTVGRVGQIHDVKIRTTVDTHVTIVRSKNQIIDPIYLGFWVKSKQEELEGLASGSTNQVELSRSRIAELKVLLPPLTAQKIIGDILSSIDEAIQKTDQIIQKSEELKSGLINELLTKGIGHKKFKKTKLGGIPEDWEVVEVGQICECIVPGRNKPKKFDGSIPWITTPNIKNSKIDYKNNINFVSKEELLNCGNKIIPTNSVIMTCVGEFGIIAVVEQEIAINQQLHAFLPSNHVIPTFLRLSLESQTEQMYNLATKTSVPYLNKTNCNSISIAIPPLAEQQEITDIIVAIENKVSANRKLLNQLKSLKNGLMYDIFNQKVQIN